MAPGWMDRLFEPYKAFVCQHPTVVQNLENLLHLLVWNPERFASSEYAYEGFNAAVGLLEILNNSIIVEHARKESGTQAPAQFNWALWLSIIQQVSVLVELRAIQMERHGKMSRYSPLLMLELVKALMRLRLWASSPSTLALAEPSPDDTHNQQRQQQLAQLLQLFERLRAREDAAASEVSGLTREQHAAKRRAYNEAAAKAMVVHAAVMSPRRPAPSCAGSEWGSQTFHTPNSTPYGTPLQSPSSSTSSIASVAPANISATAAAAARAAAAPSPTEITAADDDIDAAARVQGSSAALLSSRGGSAHTGSMGAAGHTGISSSFASLSSNNLLTHRMGELYKGTGGSSGAAVPCPVHGVRPSNSGSNISRQGSAGAGTRSGDHSVGRGAWLPRLSRPPPLTAVPSTPQFQPHVSGLTPQLDTWQLRQQAFGCAAMRSGELLYILRPLIYVFLLRKWGLKSWRPWAASLAVELASQLLLARGHEAAESAQAAAWPPVKSLYSLALLRSASLHKYQWSAAERDELLRRRAGLSRYLVRSPCYDAFTRNLLLRTTRMLRWMPLMSHVTPWLLDLVDSMQAYFTYIEAF